MHIGTRVQGRTSTFNRTPFCDSAVLDDCFRYAQAQVEKYNCPGSRIGIASQIEPSLLDSATIDELARSGGARNDSGSRLNNGKTGIQMSVGQSVGHHKERVYAARYWTQSVHASAYQNAPRFHMLSE
jgi:hypothetical protein